MLLGKCFFFFWGVGVGQSFGLVLIFLLVSLLFFLQDFFPPVDSATRYPKFVVAIFLEGAVGSQDTSGQSKAWNLTT